MGKSLIDPELQKWIEARKRFRLSHAHVQMARQLGLNPRKFGKLANHRQEPWKAPLPDFIESLYEKRFGKTRLDKVVTIEQMAEGIERAKHVGHRMMSYSRRNTPPTLCATEPGR